MKKANGISGPALRDRRAARRGTAMIEFAFCVPLLALVLALTFFFGYLMKNSQQVKVADRYAVWHDVYDPNYTPAQINALLLGGRGTNVNLPPVDHAWWLPHQTRDEWISSAEDISPEAGTFAQDTIGTRFSGFHHENFVAEFPSTVGAWQQFNGVVSSHQRNGEVWVGHSREGVEWRWRQASISTTIREQYLQSLDTLMQGMPAPADTMGAMIRRLYMNGW